MLCIHWQTLIIDIHNLGSAKINIFGNYLLKSLNFICCICNTLCRFDYSFLMDVMVVSYAFSGWLLLVFSKMYRINKSIGFISCVKHDDVESLPVF